MLFWELPKRISQRSNKYSPTLSALDSNVKSNAVTTRSVSVRLRLFENSNAIKFRLKPDPRPRANLQVVKGPPLA